MAPQFRRGHLCACSKTKFPVWKLRLGHASTSRNTENFPYTSLPKCVYSRHSILLVQYFSLSDFFWYLYLPYPPPTLKQINIAWPMTWSTLHISLYRKVLCFIKPFVSWQLLIGGEGGNREEFWSVQLFSMLRIKTLKVILLYSIACFLTADSNMKNYKVSIALLTLKVCLQALLAFSDVH